jgi:hypothetical protein
MYNAGMNSKNHFYVYCHCKMDGTIFYIGKGCLRRSKSKTNRSQAWRDVAKNGYSIFMVLENLSEEVAYSLEKSLISYFFQFGHLVNIQSGGGPVGNCYLLKNRKFSDIHLKKLSDANKSYNRDRYERSSETLSSGQWITPKGQFHSLRLAAEANFCAVMTVRNRCLGFLAKRDDKKYPVKPKNGWSFIPKEIA